MFANNVRKLDDYRSQAIEIDQPDGSVIIQFGPNVNIPRHDNSLNDFYDNIADQIDPSILASLAHDIYDGVQADETSRSQWLADRTRGLDLLALKVEQPRANIGGSGTPMDGMSTVRHPMLLEATIKFQSNSKRELLPPSGPVKVENQGLGTVPQDEQATKLGDLMNDYFTTDAPEYYPDSERMFFDLGFSGKSFKKGYHCPLRRRPVSETVKSDKLIVSNDATDLRTAQRVTHVIEMTKATVRRMQYVGAYRNVELHHPTSQPANSLKQKEMNIQGIQPSVQRPQDNQFTLWECHTFLDLAGFEHKDESGNPTGLPLPYVVTIEKESRAVLEVRRDWDLLAEDEEDVEQTYERRVTFIAYDFVPTFGFWSSGLLHILGNTTTAVTAAWRVLLDSGMFSNFPGWLYAKSGARQDDLNFRVPPGGGAPVDLNGADDIRKRIMPMPYKEPGTSTMQLVDNMIQTGNRVGAMANLIEPDKVRQNMPVGTTMALVEQAAITLGAVHERNYMSQAQEFQMMLRLFREDPKAIWRFAKRSGKWTYDELVQTLNNYALVPVADPNTPTNVHRIMKLTTLKQLQQATPEIYDPRKVDAAILRGMKFDNPDEFFVPPPPPQQMPPSDAVIIAQATKEAKMMDAQTKLQIAQITTQFNAFKLKADQEKAAADNQIKQMQLMLQKLLGEMGDETKRIQIETQAETADKDRAADDYRERLRVAQEHAITDVEHEHAAAEAKLDRAHAIDLEKAKPKPQPSGGK